MAQAVYLGVDIGSSSAKCLAVGDDGQARAFAQRPYPLAHPRAGWAEQDAEDYWRGLTEVIGRCVHECRQQGIADRAIRSLAMSTQGDTLIVTDDAARPLLPALSWMDARAEAECRDLLADSGASFWYRAIGQRLTAFSSACKIRWVARHAPDVIAHGARFCYVPDFLTRRLCGEFVTDVPSASWSPLYTPAKRDWAREVVDLLDLPADGLPRAVESGTVIGQLPREAAAGLHLQSDVTLVAGAFDQAAAACGAGATAGSRSILSCGTAWVLYSVSASPVSDDREQLATCCHTDPAEWGMVLPFTGGSAYDWLGRTIPADDDQPPSGAPPLLFIPHLYGGLSPDWRGQSKGSLVGLTLSHTARDIEAALMRGLAFEGRRNLEAAQRVGERIESVRMVGGAGRSDIWPQLIANILNRPVELTGRLESACYGAARLAAGDAASNWPDADSVREFSPQPNEVEAENERYAQYLDCYQALLSIYESEGEQP